MCACRLKKSFFIEDILGDGINNKSLNKSLDLSKPLPCGRSAKSVAVLEGPKESARFENEKSARFNLVCGVEKELELNSPKVNLEQRRNTYPLHPTPVKASAWPAYRMKSDYPPGPRQSFSYFSDPILNADQILRSQLASCSYLQHPFPLRQPLSFDRNGASCCGSWWGLSARRKGGQVRFSAAQTSALEKRFGASKYLSPDERRAFAGSLRLSDRQVKTWFQNRRAKWRRTTPEGADAGSPLTVDDASDDELNVDDDQQSSV